MQDTRTLPHPLPQERNALFEQLSSVLAMHGQHLNMEAYSLLKPLLDGSLDYAEHEAMLTGLLESLAHDQA
jgi:hypothetical protein